MNTCGPVLYNLVNTAILIMYIWSQVFHPLISEVMQLYSLTKTIHTVGTVTISALYFLLCGKYQLISTALFQTLTWYSMMKAWE